MFIRIVGESKKEIRDVAPDTANGLVDKNCISFCMKCKVFHPCDGISWRKLTVAIKDLAN